MVHTEELETPSSGRLARLLSDNKARPFLSKGTPQVASKETVKEAKVLIDSEEDFLVHDEFSGSIDNVIKTPDTRQNTKLISSFTESSQNVSPERKP